MRYCLKNQHGDLIYEQGMEIHETRNLRQRLPRKLVIIVLQKDITGDCDRDRLSGYEEHPGRKVGSTFAALNSRGRPTWKGGVHIHPLTS